MTDVREDLEIAKAVTKDAKSITASDPMAVCLLIRGLVKRVEDAEEKERMTAQANRECLEEIEALKAENAKLDFEKKYAEGYVNICREERDAIEEKLSAQAKALEEARKALQFYADPNDWKPLTGWEEGRKHTGIVQAPPICHVDEGDVAREALRRLPLAQTDHVGDAVQMILKSSRPLTPEERKSVNDFFWKQMEEEAHPATESGIKDPCKECNGYKIGLDGHTVCRRCEGDGVEPKIGTIERKGGVDHGGK